ncbi:dihydrofolate reductase [Dysgonomonas sp. 25]|uniref:dihydrofolate reductase n=1 Tax=Dysgonomonas sp. 25 TaxID=2302933 RepID=UPI0013D8AA0E|nr:dihydrofolate reductase [Dysgonomonas sp. 25]NDV70107.1 dihydrofolate reductase [Dysgonomonas sp. 25]
MSTISIIVAVDENNAIGKDNKLLCHLPNDLKYFKSVTSGSPVIMGRKTFESLPNGALPNRRNIVISRNKQLQYPNTEMAGSIEDAIALCQGENEVFIIGGGTIYQEAIHFADKLYITLIHHKFEGTDTFFPAIDSNSWQEVWREDHPADEKHRYDYSFVRYEKINR